MLNKDDNIITYNKRQFWEYKRLVGNTNKQVSNNVLKTKKIFHVINNKVATDKVLVKRLSSIYIPPAYKNIVIAKSALNKIQAIGTDKRGRRQYVYNSTYTKKRNNRKYEDIMELAKHISKIESDNNLAIELLAKKKLVDWKLPDDYIPIIIYILRTYHFRIGNEKYVNDNNSYGITTLRAEHIKFHSSNHFTIEFIGKKGILNSFSDKNVIFANILGKLIDGSKCKNHDGYLFKYVNNGIFNFVTPEYIQSFFLDNYKAYITPKMFRTWYGNYYLLVYLRKMFNEGNLQHHLSKKDKNSIIYECSEYVSQKLNNTPNVSKKSYIDNKILELVMRNPYRLASNIPDDNISQHKFLYKIILKIRQ